MKEGGRYTPNPFSVIKIMLTEYLHATTTALNSYFFQEVFPGFSGMYETD